MNKTVLAIALFIGSVGLVQADEGKALYDQICSVCHDEGIAGAPKMGKASDWEPLLINGVEPVVNTAISGKGAMPPRGGSGADDATIRAAVEYMLQQST